MPVYEIEAPDGRVFEVEGDREPTQAELSELVASFDQPAQDQPAAPAASAATVLPGLGMGEVASRVGKVLMDVWDGAEKIGEAATFQAGAAKEEGAILGGPVRGALQGTGAAVKAAGILGDYVGIDPQTGLIGGGPKGDPRDGLLYRTGQAIQDVAAKMPQPSERSFMDDVLEGVGQVGPGIAAAVVAGPGGAFAMGGAQEFTDAYDRELERQKKDGEVTDYGKAFVKATTYGLTAGAIEARFGAGRIVKKVKDALTGKLAISGTKELILGRMKDAGVGFTEEAVQRAIQDLIVDGQLDRDAILQEGGVGAVVQGILGLPGAALSMRAPKAVNKEIEAAAQAADNAGLSSVAQAIRESENLVQGEPGDKEFEALVSAPITENISETETSAQGALPNEPNMGGAVSVPSGQETATQVETQEVTNEVQETQGQEGLIQKRSVDDPNSEDYIPDIDRIGDPFNEDVQFVPLSKDAQSYLDSLKEVTLTNESALQQKGTRREGKTQGQEGLLGPTIDTVPGEATTANDPGAVVETYAPDALAADVGTFLQTDGLPEGVTIVQEPESPWAAKLDNGKIVLNASQIKPGSNVGNVLLEEGLHGVWDSPELSEAWRSWKRSATRSDVATERKAREGQQLPDDVLQEEAVIQRLLANKPEDQGVIRKVYEAIRRALRRLFGLSVPDTAQGRKALLDAARSYVTRRQEYNKVRYAAPQVKPSKGFFKGDYLTRPDEQTEREANDFLGTFRTEQDALTALENPTTNLRGDSLAQAIGILGDRILTRMYQTDDPGELHTLRNLAVRLAKLGQVSGTVEAQDFRARQRMKDKLTPHSAMLTLLNLINDQQRKVVDQVVDVPAVTEGVKQGMEQAGEQATETIKRAVRAPKTKQDAQAKLEPPSKTAKAIVNRLAKSQSDTPSWPVEASDEVEAAVRAQLDQKSPTEAFASVLVSLGVRPEIATQLSELVAREIEVRQRVEDAKADARAADEIKDSTKIARLLDKAGVEEDVDWTELFTSSQATQKERQREFFERIQNDPRFSRLSKAERAELANTLFKAWELQRLRIFRREFDRLLPGDADTVQGRIVKRALPKLIEYINLGMLDADATRDAIAGVFGMETMDGALVKRIQDLSEQAQKMPLDSIQQNQALNRIHRELVANAKIPLDKLMSDFWYSNVLGRTSTFLNVLMGSFFTGLWAQTLLTEKVLLADRAPGDVLRMWRGFFRGLGDSILAGAYITATGDRSVLPGYRKEVDAALSMKNPEKGIDTFEALVDRYTREGKKFRATWAKGQALTKRIMTALDYIGSQGVREAALFSAAHSQGDEAALEKLRARFNRDATKQADQQARAELGDKAPLPVLRARRREILEQGINQDVLDAADNVRRRVAANAEPHGLVGLIYKLAKPAPFLVKSMFGLQFMRAAANMINWTSDAIPGVGLAKYAQSKLPKGNSLYVPLSAEDRALALGAQATGLALIAGLAAMFLNDDEDDGWDITAGWAGLTPSQKKLLRDKGESTYSITTPYGKFSYKQISGLNAALAFVGTLRDQQRFNKEQWNEKSALAKLFHAYLFGSIGVIKDLNTITSITDVLGQTAGGSDEAYEARLVNFLTRFGSGFVPFRGSLSEFDAYTDRKKYIPDKEDVTGALLRNLPFARRAIGEGPDLNLFGEPIKTPPNLLKNWVDISEAPPEWKTVARMAENGYWLSEANLGGKDFVDPFTGDKREMTMIEKRAYVQARGAIIKEHILLNGKELDTMNAEELADDWKPVLDEARRAGKSAAEEAAIDLRK